MKTTLVTAAILGMLAGAITANSDTLYDAQNRAIRKGTGKLTGKSVDWTDCNSHKVLHFDSSYYFRAGSECQRSLVDTASCKGKNICKGRGGCKTNEHSCKGKNDCKGRGGCRSDAANCKSMHSSKKKSPNN